MFIFLSLLCLCQFICIFLTFYCIYFPFVLFGSNFSLLYLFLYIATIFSSPFHFHPTDYMYYFLLGIPLCAVWCLLFCKGDMLCLIHFFFFFLQLHFVFHICNLIFMTSFKASFSHFSIYRFLSHLSFCIVGHFGFSCIYIYFHSFSYSVYCFPFTFLFSF